MLFKDFWNTVPNIFLKSYYMICLWFHPHFHYICSLISSVFSSTVLCSFVIAFTSVTTFLCISKCRVSLCSLNLSSTLTARCETEHLVLKISVHCTQSIEHARGRCYSRILLKFPLNIKGSIVRDISTVNKINLICKKMGGLSICLDKIILKTVPNVYYKARMLKLKS